MVKFNYHHQQQQRQQMNNNSDTNSTPQVEASSRADSGSTSSRPISNSGRRFVKSKSSPSSLTTHKFGLRPTPSPPRLIIDHQTGDIVERYPENPVYLRTYQPLELLDNNNKINEDENSADDDTTQNQIDDSFASNSSVNQSVIMSQQSSSQQAQHPNHHHRISGGQVIPPPHSGKVYFAPPALANNIFEQPQPQQQQQQPSLRSTVQAAVAAASTPNASFRRALQNINSPSATGDLDERTDIAIVTEPEDYDLLDADSNEQLPTRMKITATSPSRASALLARQQPRFVQQQASNANKLYGQPAPLMLTSRSSFRSASSGNNQQRVNYSQKRQFTTSENSPPASIDDFKLYNFCFILRILLVLIISTLIIYLLIEPLHLDCSKFKPTYAYISIISSSVNLIFVIIFTLFWYCTSVSRTLYQNLSSSAFIVTIYSILVCLNLALAILFFFINTCHFQKLLATHSAHSDMEVTSGLRLPALLESDYLINQYSDADWQPSQYANLRRFEEIIETLEEASAHSKNQELAGNRLAKQQQQSRQKRQDDDGTVLDDQLPAYQQQTSTTSTASPAQAQQPPPPPPSDFFNQDHTSGYEQVPELSPIEAFWEYLKELARLFKRNFYKFLLNYDLKFIGALHAICAACFQYLAIKVAVVRSYYCSPMGLYA